MVRNFREFDKNIENEDGANITSSSSSSNSTTNDDDFVMGNSNDDDFDKINEELDMNLDTLKKSKTKGKMKKEIEVADDVDDEEE